MLFYLDLIRLNNIFKISDKKGELNPHRIKGGYLQSSFGLARIKSKRR